MKVREITYSRRIINKNSWVVFEKKSIELGEFKLDQFVLLTIKSEFPFTMLTSYRCR